MAEVDYQGYARSMGARNPIASGLADIGQTLDDNQKRLMQQRQLEMQQQGQDRQNRLADMQLNKYRKEEQFQTGLESAMQNPQTVANPASLKQLGAYTPEALALDKMTPEQQAFAAQSTQGQAAKQQLDLANAPAVPATVTESPAQAGIKYAMSKNRYDEANKLFSLDDKMNEMAAHVLDSGGDPVAYHQAKAQLKDLDAFVGDVKELAKNPTALKAAWPLLIKLHPSAAGLSPDMVAVTPDGTVTPMMLNGQIVPNKVILTDDAGKKTVHDIAEKPDQAALLDKRLEAQAAQTDKQIAAADRRSSAQIAASERKAGGGAGLGKLDFESAKSTIKTLPKLKEEAIGANSGVERIDTMMGLLSKGAGGKGGQILGVLAPYAEMIGVNTKGMNEAQTYQLMAKTIGGSMRMQIIGPGPVSNYENQLLQSISGGGSTGQAAAKELLSYYKKTALEKINDYNDTVTAVSEFSPATAKIHKKIGGAKPAARPPLSAIFGK